MTLVANQETRPPDRVGIDLLQQALRWVHSSDADTTRDPALKERMGGGANEVIDTAAAWIESVRSTDPMLAWSLLYALDHFAVPGAVELFAREALRPIPDDDGGDGCQQHGDLDELVGVQASEALARRVTAAERGARDALLSVVASQSRPAIQVAAALALRTADPHSEADLVKALGARAECLTWRPVIEADMAVELDAAMPLESPPRPPHLDRPANPRGADRG